jgi:peptidyl-prolyl cis-trans isomerase C
MEKHNIKVLNIVSLMILSSVLMAFSYPLKTFVPNSDDETVIQINNYKIGYREFEDRLNDLPLPNESSYPLDELKENLACTLIAESVLAMEAQKENMDTLSQVKLFSDQFHKEALYEQWMNAEVKSKVQVKDDEVQRGYNRLQEIRHVDYWTSPTDKGANEIRSKVIKGKKTDIKPTLKQLEYGQALENVEDSVYSMKVGQISRPIKIDSLYYVFKLVKTEKDKRYTKEDVGFYRSTITERIRAKKELYAMSDKLNVLMQDKGYSLDTKAYKFLVNRLEPIIFNEQNPKENRAIIIQQEISGTSTNNEDMFSKPLIEFKGGKTWTVADVWQKLSVCPYPLNFDSPKELKYGLIDVLKEVVLLESIATDSDGKGYGNSYYVQYQSQMWNNNLLAGSLLSKFRESNPVDEKDLLAFYDTTKTQHMQPERRKIIPVVVKDKKLANNIYKQIQGGADILTLAKKYSVNKINLDAKEPGSYITSGSWGEAGKAVFKLTPGQITKPEKVDDTTYAIIKLLEVKSTEPYSYNQIHDQLYGTYQDLKLQEYVDGFLLKVIKNYDIKINWKTLSQVQFFGGNMGVKKTHFPLRSAVPGFPFFLHSAKWFNEGVSRNKF